MQKIAYRFSPIYHALKFLALESAFWPEIDKLFKDLKPKSLAEAKKHQRDGGYIISALPHRARLRAVELIGIDLVDHEACNYLIGKMYRHEIEWIEHHKDSLDFIEFLHQFAKKGSTNDYERLFVVFHIIVVVNHLDFDHDDEIYNQLLVRISDAYNSRFDQRKFKINDDWIKSEAKDLENQWFGMYKQVDSINELQYNERLYGPMTDVLERLMITEGYSLANLEERKFSRSEIKDIIGSYCGSSDSRPEFDDLCDCMAPAMIVKALSRVAVQATDDYIELALTTETEKATTYKRQARELEKQLDDSKSLATTLQGKLNEISVAHDRLKLETLDLKSENEKLRDELAAMQAAMEEPEEVTGKAKLLFPADKKIVVLGGNPNWQNKVAARYPGVTIIAPDNFNFDPGLVKGADIVCFNWLYASHGQYYRLVNAVDKKSIVYIANNNLDVFEAAVAAASQKK